MKIKRQLKSFPVMLLMTALVISQAGAVITPPTYAAKWGDTGFHTMSPGDMASDSAGNIYIIERITSQLSIKKYSPAGVLLKSFGATGTGDGRLTSPRALAVDGSGNVYCFDAGRKDVQKFSSAGAYLAKWAITGSYGTYVDAGMTTDPAGNVYLASGAVHKISQSGAVSQFINTGGVSNDAISNNYTDIARAPSGKFYIIDDYNMRQLSSTGLFSNTWSVNDIDNYGEYLDVDSNGYLYLTNTNYLYLTSQDIGSVIKYSVSANTATEATRWTVSQESYPMFGGFCLDPSGNFYLSDNGNIGKFNSAGSRLATWKTWGNGNGFFSGPSGIAATGNGSVFVADTYNDRLQKFDRAGNFKLKWGKGAATGAYGTGQGEFYYPSRICATGNAVFVADTYNNRVQKFDLSGSFQLKLGSSTGGYGTQDGFLYEPSDVDVDSSGNIYVLDSGNNRVQKYNASGVYQAKWALNRVRCPQGTYAYGLAISGNTGTNYVYVADTDMDRIVKYNTSGSVIAKWGSYGSSDGQFDNPMDVDVDSQGNVYVADSGNNRIQKFTADGTFLCKWGTSGEANGQFYNPSGVTVDSDGSVFVADSGNNRVQKFVGVIADTTAPVITLKSTPLLVNGLNGYFKTRPSFTLTANETATRYYRKGSGSTTGYSLAVPVPNGINTYTYWGKDTAGNLATKKSKVFKVDSFIPAGYVTSSNFYRTRPGRYVTQVMKEYGNVYLKATLRVKKYGTTTYVRTLYGNQSKLASYAGRTYKTWWNGKNNSGGLVARGKYVIELRLTDPAGNTKTLNKVVTVL